MAELHASADIHGHAIRLSLSWSDPSTLGRSLLVVRRRTGYSHHRDEGLVVLDLADVFPDAGAVLPWGLIDRQRFLVPNSKAEGGLLQAELAQYYVHASDPQPTKVVVKIYDSGHSALMSSVITSVTHVTTETVMTVPAGAVTTIAIYATPGSHAEQLAGTFTVSTQSAAPGAVETVTDYTQFDPEAGGPPLVIETPGPSPGLVDWIPVAQAVSAASNTAPITVITANSHWLSSGATVTISGVTGNSAANGTWSVVVTGPATLVLTGSAGNGAYTGGGLVAPPTASQAFFLGERQRTLSTIRAVEPLDVSFNTGVVVAGASIVSIREVTYTEVHDPDAGEISRSFVVMDRDPPTRSQETFTGGLDDRVTYYYEAWEDSGTGYAELPTWQAFSVATGDNGFAARLFAMLPAVHRYYDDPASGPQPGTGVPGSWQLRRFLEVVGPALDEIYGLGESLRSLRDVFDTRADLLAKLGHGIGWEVDRTLPTHRQRADVLFAPEVFSTVGTVPNIEALVHRATGWTCQAKEFVNNVFLTNFAEEIRAWEIWHALRSGSVLTLPVAQTPVTQAINGSIDARPALALEPADGGAPWLFWHSTRPDQSKTPPSTRRQIWMARLDGSVPPRPVMLGAPDDGNDLSFSDEWPAAVAEGAVVRLFWSSDRSGTSCLWTRTLAKGVPGPATRLTHHPAGDHCPGVAKDAAGTLWLFWHSSRRGPTDIWAMNAPAGSGVWSSPIRITSGQPRDQMPTAFLDSSNTLRLSWSADLGDRSRILQSTLSGGTWTPRVCVSSAPDDRSTFRDQAPTALQLGPVVWVFWSSNRDGIDRLWASQQIGSAWSSAATVTSGRHQEREPAAFLDAVGQLHLLFRTQQGGEAFRSRTVDMSDPGAVRRGFLDDRWHYTYSIATDPSSCYARDTVGLYITPDENADLDEADRVRSLVEPFRPLPVRFLWFVEPPVLKETVYAPVDIQESYFDSADYVGPVGDSSSAAVPEWNVFHTNTPGDVSAKAADLTTLRHRVYFPTPQ